MSRAAREQRRRIGTARQKRVLTRYERYAHLCRFVAETPLDAVPLIVCAAEKTICVQMPLKDGVTRRWRFQTRSARDRFVHLFADKGARRC